MCARRGKAFAAAAVIAACGSALAQSTSSTSPLELKKLMIPVAGVTAAPPPTCATHLMKAVPVTATRPSTSTSTSPHRTALPCWPQTMARSSKIFTSQPGGLTLYEFDLERRFAYYYAHLDRYADGLAEGMALHRGQILGYVGTTGNAPTNVPHLHFAVFRLWARHTSG